MHKCQTAAKPPSRDETCSPHICAAKSLMLSSAQELFVLDLPQHFCDKKTFGELRCSVSDLKRLLFDSYYSKFKVCTPEMVYSMPDLEVVWKSRLSSLVISVSSPFLQLFTAVLVLFFYAVPKYYSTRLTSYRCATHQTLWRYWCAGMWSGNGIWSRTHECVRFSERCSGPLWLSPVVALRSTTMRSMKTGTKTGSC